eukprot:CAMPEP_0168533356 /NCGR_PEP_ID=MMETSP0405-20121227/17020_1 /TAXON_ID=498012 /ORGANISM="Trichosphaerium sp, Strain Am-I-7 wt" /LENGTH=543 /DNA_ID=CAMNT_0008559385 /DNA_START=519 /DNA_END=2147 /DNA_ORIENTATION=-
MRNSLIIFLLLCVNVLHGWSLDKPIHPSLEEYTYQREHVGEGIGSLPDGLWPLPRQMTSSGDTITVNPTTFRISSSSSGSILQDAISRYMKYLFPIPTQNGTSSVSKLEVTLNLPYNENLTLSTDESYDLTLSKTAFTLKANTVFGALRGLETFSQLVTFNYNSYEYSAKLVTISDRPRLSYRGVMIDTARRFMTVSSLKGLIDQMSFYKLNSLHLHLIDTDSWPLEVPGYPLLTQKGAYSKQAHTYSVSDVKDLVSYALHRGVKIIPEIDTPGHSYSICYAYPDLCVEYESNGKLSRGVLPDPSNEKTWEFFDSMWSYVASVFPSDQVGIGFDETDLSQWQKSPAVQALMKQKGFTQVSQVLGYYCERLLTILAKYNKKALGWYPGLPSLTPISKYPNLAYDTWDGWIPNTQWQPAFKDLTSKGGHVILSGPYYVVDPRRENIQKSYTWQQMYATNPTDFSGTASEQALVLGGQLTVFDDAAITDSGNIITKITPYLGAVGETWWSDPQSLDMTRFAAQRCRTIMRGVPSNPQAGGDIHNYH